MCIIGQLENEVEYKHFHWKQHYNQRTEALGKPWCEYKAWQRVLTLLYDEKADAERRLREKRMEKPSLEEHGLLKHNGWTLGSIHPNYGCGCKNNL